MFNGQKNVLTCLNWECAYQHGHTADKELVLLGKAKALGCAKVLLQQPVGSPHQLQISNTLYDMYIFNVSAASKQLLRRVQKHTFLHHLDEIAGVIEFMRTVGFEGSMAFWVGPAGRFLTSAWLSSSKVGPKGFRAVMKLNACRTNHHFINK